MIFLSKMLTKGQVVMLNEGTKEQILEQLVHVLATSEKVHNERELLEAIRGRELIMSTGIGFGIAVPHAKIKSVDDVVMAVGVARAGIDFGSLDDKPVHIVVMIAANAEQQDTYIRALARVMMILKNPKTRDKIIAAKNTAEVYDVFAKF
jgi:mannitol/fructose-specific phosphotransferase system IIA component (Ntr-type)